MTVTVTPQTRTITNGTPNDAAPIQASFTELYANDQTLATALNSIVVSTFNYKFGCLPTYVSTSTITISSGAYADSGNAAIITIPSTLTVNISNTGALGLDTGTLAVNTWYYIWLSSGTSGVTAFFSASNTTPTLPTGYSSYKRLLPFAVSTDASKNLIPFYIGGGWPDRPWVEFPGAQRIASANNGIGVITFSAASVVPPISKWIKVNLTNTSGTILTVVSANGSSSGRSLEILTNSTGYTETATDGSQVYQTNTSMISGTAPSISHDVLGFLVTEVS